MFPTPRSSLVTPGIGRSIPISASWLAVILTTGCGGDGGPAASSFADAPWTFDGPEVRIGSLDDPDYIFASVNRLALSPDGLLHSLHPDEATIRQWTAEGTPAGSVGRAGEGPGEFVVPYSMGFFGDSLWVWDVLRSSASYFDLAGEFLGSASAMVGSGGPDGLPLRPVRPYRDGGFLGMALPFSEQVATGQLTRTPFVLMDSEGNTQSHIWMHPHEPRDVLALPGMDGTGGSYSTQPFLDDVLATDIDHGVLAVERRAWTGDGEAVVTVTGIGLTGDTLFTNRVSYTPTPLPTARVDSVVRATAERMHPSMSRRRPGLTIGALEEDIRKAIYAPAYLPAVAELAVARNGNIWLRRFDPVESETGEQMNEWWVLDPAGVPLARAHTPAGLRVMLIGDEAVWGVESDELDVDYIVRYRLVKDG